MDEIIKIVIDYGVTSIMMASIFYLGFKYIPKIIDISMDRMKKRDYRDELLKQQIESNTQAIKSIEKVIEHNTEIIKSNSDKCLKIDKQIKVLNNLIKEYSFNTNNIIDQLKSERDKL